MRKIDPVDGQEFQSQYLLRVDRSGRPLGIEEKERCHRGEGIWHSAFLVMIFDERARLMQARRSRAKKLWPDYWDGTVAGHFAPGEGYEASVKNRVFQEIGFACDRADFLFKFSYQSRYKDIGIEKEVCHIFRVQNIKKGAIALNKSEVSEFQFSTLQELAGTIKTAAGEFTPWFLLAFRKILSRAQ